MFHWICPECGCEIAPTVRDCPVCDGPEQAEPVLAGVVEASARTTSTSEIADHPAASGSLLTTEALLTNDLKVETAPSQPVPVEALAKEAQPKEKAQPILQAQAQTEIPAPVARTGAGLLETALETGVAAVSEADSTPVSIALLEDVADLHAPVQESPNWRRKNGYAPASNGSAQGQTEAAARNGSTGTGSAEGESPVAESAAKKEELLDAPEAMKLLAAPVAIPHPAPLASVPVAPAIAGPLTAEPLSPQQVQDASAALQNLSSGVAETALVVPAAQSEKVQPEAAEVQEAAPASVEENQASLKENQAGPEENHASVDHASPESSVATLTSGAASQPALERDLEPASESISDSPSESEPALIPEILDAKAAAEKSIGARAADLLARLNTSREDTERVARSVRTKTVESRAVETREVETHEVDGQPVETHELNGKALNGQPLNGKIANGKTPNAKTEDVTPVNAQPVAAAAPAAQESTQTNAPVAAPKDITLPPLAPQAPPAPQPPQATQTKTGKFGRLLRMASDGHKPAAVTPASKVNHPVPAPPPIPAAASDPASAAPNSAASNSQATASAVVSQSPNTAPSKPEAADLGIAPFDAKARQLPLPLRPAPVSPTNVSPANIPAAPISSNAALAAEPKEPESGAEAATKADASPISNVPFSENAPLLANKLRQAPTEPALVDQKLPMAQPAAMNMPVSFAPPVAIPPSAGSVRPPRSKVDGPAPRYGRLVRNPAIAKSALRVATPPRDAITTPLAPSLTLPGPMLTPSLVAFRDKELVPKFIGFGPQRKRWGNAWLVVALLGGTTLGVGLTGLLSNLPRPEPSFKEAAKDAPAPAETANAAPAPAPTPAAKPATHLIPKSIELSGFRLVGDPNNGGEQVRFTVVNHGPTRFTDGIVYVALRAANARPGQPPLYRFTFPAPNLGPYEAREMSSVVKKSSEDASLPGWQDLRADVEVGQP